MAIVNDKFSAARKASDLTIKKASELAGLSKQGYINREKEPSQFRLCELDRLYNGMTPTAKGILKEAINDIFLPE